MEDVLPRRVSWEDAVKVKSEKLKVKSKKLKVKSEELKVKNERLTMNSELRIDKSGIIFRILVLYKQPELTIIYH